MSNFIIKPAAKGDIPIILDFIRKIAEYEKLSYEVVATEEILFNSLFGEKPSAEAIIAYLDDFPVGFAVFFHNFSTFHGRPGLYLEDLFVLKEHRQKGYGKALFDYLVKLALERNCPRFEWSVLDWNEPAINFYKALGAKPMDEWTVFRLDGDNLRKFNNQNTNQSVTLK